MLMPREVDVSQIPKLRQGWSLVLLVPIAKTASLSSKVFPFDNTLIRGQEHSRLGSLEPEAQPQATILLRKRAL